MVWLHLQTSLQLQTSLAEGKEGESYQQSKFNFLKGLNREINSYLWLFTK